MTMEAALKQLNTHLHALREELAALRTTICEDGPPRGETVFVDVFCDPAEDMLGRVAEALVAAHAAQQAAGHPLDLGRAWRALSTCQQQFNQIQYRLFDLLSYERLAPLMRFGHQQGGKWRAWTGSARAGLERCPQAASEVSQALFQAWQEIAESAGLTSVSVQTTTIGQHVSVPDSRESVREPAP